MKRSALLLAVAVALGACSGARPVVRPAPQATQPSPTQTPSEPVVRFAAVGDFGDGSVAERRVANAIAAEHAIRPFDVLLLLGDMIYPDGDPAEVDKKFRAPYAKVLETGVHTAAVLGNHDIQTDAAAIMDAFAMPSRWYTFTRGPIDFFALDSSKGFVETNQLRWFESALRRSTARWKIAFMHVPAYSSGMHGTNPALRDALVPAMKRYGVTMMITGHDHNYERTIPIQGTVHVISGGGCCIRPVGTGSFTARALSALHFITVETTIDSLLLKAIGADGTVLDRALIA